MPRQKKQPLGELLGLRVPQDDQQSILSVLDGLPPLAYWVNCKTDDQKEHLDGLKEGYAFIKYEMQRYFGGQGSLIPYLEDRERDFFGALVSRYIAWYGVAQAGWAYVEEELKDVGLTTAEIRAGCPGEALIRVIENECAALISDAFIGYARYSPAEDRRLAKAQLKIKKGTATEAEKKKHIRVTGQNFKPCAKFFHLTLAVVNACEKHKSKSKALTTALKNYHRAMGDLERAIAKQHHPRNKKRGYEWKNGLKSALEKG